MTIRSYRDLVVWQKSVDLATHIYRLSSTLPTDERWRLVAQVTRAAVSIPSNIAEGHERNSRADYRRHVSIARGSVAELETQLVLMLRLEYASADELREIWALANEVGRMLTTLEARLRSGPKP